MARSTRPAPPAPAATAPVWPWLAVPLVLGLAVRLMLAAGTAGLTMDSPLYVRMAEGLRHGVHEAAPAHHGYPLLVALASRVVPGREWPGRAVSLLASLALVVLVHGAVRRRLGVRLATLAASLVALHPLLAIYG